MDAAIKQASVATGLAFPRPPEPKLNLALPNLSHAITFYGPYLFEPELVTAIGGMGGADLQRPLGGLFAIVRDEGGFQKLCGVGHTPELSVCLQRSLRLLGGPGSSEEKLKDIELMLKHAGGAGSFTNFLPPPVSVPWWKFRLRGVESLGVCFSPSTSKNAQGDAATVAASGRAGAIPLFAV